MSGARGGAGTAGARETGDSVSALGKPCQRRGCEGRYDDMGGGELYCDVCGLAPVVAPGGMLGAAPTGLTSAARGSEASSASGASSRSSARSSSRSRSSRRSVSGRLSQDLSGQSTARAVSVRSSSRSSAAASSRNRLGAGLVSVPEVPKADPGTVVLDDPEVPERKRFCSNSDCGSAVGRSRGDRPGRTEGFCTNCGHPYSFVPKLRRGDVVHGQYEVAGCLAHGGLGWIYLAVDRAVSDRWVVLKGLLDTGDEDAMAAAISERRFLAEIEHSNIVRIYNFVEHLDKRTGSLDGYIVMEYVGGKSLKEIANSRRTPGGSRDPVPVEQACAYGLEALEALGHLHARNLLYCDFKADNAIQQEDQLKLIDMGAVRRADDHESAIYGTVGYQAPEVAAEGASVASDLYTVARTLAVLTFDFQGYTNVFADSLPDPEGVEIFQQYESFYRFLVRATDPDPQRRFASAEEMSEQLTGVLREVVAVQTERPRPAMSTLFGPEVRVVDTELLERTTGGLRAGCASEPREATAPAPAPASRPPRGAPHEAAAGSRRCARTGARRTALALPVPRTDTADPNAGFLAGLPASSPAELVSALREAPTDSVELRLRDCARIWSWRAPRAVRPPPKPWRTGDTAPRRLARHLVPRAGGARHRRPGDRGARLRRGLRRLSGRARAQARAGRMRGGAGAVGQRRRVLPPRVGDRPRLRQRGLRTRTGTPRDGRPVRRGRGPGVGAGGVHPLHGGACRRRPCADQATRTARTAARRSVRRGAPGRAAAGRRTRRPAEGRR